MSLELNADNLNEFLLAQQQNEDKAKTTEENKRIDQNQLNHAFPFQPAINSGFVAQNESKEKEAKTVYEKKDSYDDEIKIMKKDQLPIMNNFNLVSDANQANSAFGKEAFNYPNNNNFSNQENQSVIDINRISGFSVDNVDYSKYYDQSKSKYASAASNNFSNNPNTSRTNSYNNFSNNANYTNSYKNADSSNNYANNPGAANYWKMRYSANPSMFQRIMREDEQLVQEHIYNQKKKETLEVSNYKNIDIDISYNNQKIIERSELTYFDDITDLDPQLKKNLHTLNFKLMTPIQREVIKFIRDGKDVMGCSQTGSGKTIAFLLPIISRILAEMPAALNSSPPSPRLLILIPTRELAEQIWTEAKKLVKETGIIVNKIYGGVPYDEQLERMYSGCDILVATPGRLLDFFKNNNLSLRNVKYLIMDEADRMLDMGFQPQLMKIAFNCDLMQKELRQNLLFSATFTEEIKTISRNFMHDDYYFIQTIFEKNPSKNIKQELYYAAESEKIDKLHGILKATSGSIIIFVETKFGVDNLYLALKKYGHRVSCIHGDKKQQQRQEAIKRFSMGQISILIATDIASRGLDFPKVTHVINFDLPTNIEDYIHRIGRTGRCGNTGTAISFVNEYNKPIIRNLYYFMKKNQQKINDWFENLYKNCKDISVNIFDRIPKKPKRSLGGYGASKYSSSNNYSSAAANSNYNSMSNTSNAFNSFNNSNVNNQSNFYNSYPTNINNQNSNFAASSSSNFNNFAQPISTSTSSYDRGDKHDKYDRHDKYDKSDSRRDSSSSRYPPSTSGSAEVPNSKFSGSTTYTPTTDSGSRESGFAAKYSSSQSRGIPDNFSSSSGSRPSNNHQFLGKKHPYPSSSSSSYSKDNEESSYQRNRRSRFEYESGNNSSKAENPNLNSYSDSNRKDRSESYRDSRETRDSRDSRENRYSSNYNSSGNRGYDRGDSGKSSNFNSSASNYKNNFSSGNSNNNFSSYPIANSNVAYSTNVKDNSANSDEKGNTGKSGFTAQQGANSMYPQVPGVGMNYMYPGMNYANYYAQSNSNNKSANAQDPSNSTNKPSATSNPIVQANPLEAKNTNPIANANATSTANNATNAYSAYYNYAAAYSAYGYGANYPGYDPYNGQVYDAYKYSYGYPATEGNLNSNANSNPNPNANTNSDNKSNQENK